MFEAIEIFPFVCISLSLLNKHHYEWFIVSQTLGSSHLKYLWIMYEANCFKLL